MYKSCRTSAFLDQHVLKGSYHETKKSFNTDAGGMIIKNLMSQLNPRESQDNQLRARD